jgi:hypothetical protein
MTAILVAGRLGVRSSVDLLSCLSRSVDQEATGGVLRKRCLGGEPSCRLSATVGVLRRRRLGGAPSCRWSRGVMAVWRRRRGGSHSSTACSSFMAGSGGHPR